MRSRKDDSSDSDEDPRLAYKKAQKKSIVPPVSQIMNMSETQNMEFGSKTMTKNMFQQRGLQFNDDELKKMGSASAASNAAAKKGGAFVAGGGEASVAELKKELQNSLNKNDIKTACMVLKYMIEKETVLEEKRKYAIQRCQLLLELKSYSDCVTEAEKWIATSSKQRDYAFQKFSVNIRLLLAKAKSHLGEVWSGYLELQRAEGFCQGLILLKQQEAQGEGKSKGAKSEVEINWGESETDMLLRELQDTALLFKVKLQQEKRVTAFMYSSGFSNTGCLGLESVSSAKVALLPQLRNRQVVSIACGDHHTIALVKANSCSLLHYPNYSQISQTFDQSYEVFGWGENTCGQITGDSTHTKLVEKPLLLSFFSGKQITVLGAHKASSLAVDQAGQVYEWGANKFSKSESSDFEVTITLPQKDILQICRGTSVYAIRDSKQQCYWWGQLKNVLYKKDLQSANIPSATGISIGYNHILITDAKGKVFGLGDNSKGQLALGTNKQFAANFEEILQLKGTQITCASAFQDASFFISAEGDLQYSGQISANKQTSFIKEAEFPEAGIKIHAATGYDGQLFALSNDGVGYTWDAESTVKFKQHKDLGQNTFRDLRVGAGFQIYTKSLPYPKISTTRVTNEDILETFEPITIDVELLDQQGTWGLKPFYPMRYQLLLSEKKDLDFGEVVNLAQNVSDMNRNTFTEEKLYINEIGSGNAAIFTLSVQQNPQTPHIHTIELSIENAGVYFCYILLNEELIGVKPIQLRVVTSAAEQARKQEMQALEKKKILQAEEKRRKEEDNDRRIQALLEDEARQQELADQKKRETDERAKEAYQKYLREQQEKKSKEEEERKRRAELQTGGGFDLEKAAYLKQQELKKMSLQKQPSLKEQTTMGVESVEKKPIAPLKPLLNPITKPQGIMNMTGRPSANSIASNGGNGTSQVRAPSQTQSQQSQRPSLGGTGLAAKPGIRPVVIKKK